MSRYQLQIGQTARLWVSFLCYTLSTSMTGPLIGLYAHRLGASSSEIGVVYGLAAFTTLLTRLPLASLQRRLGSRLLIRVGVLANSASMIAYAFSPSINYMYLASGLRGIGFASFHPPALSEAVRLSSNNQRLGWVMTAPPMGMSLGPLLSSSLLAFFNARFGYPLLYILTFLTSAALSGIAFFTPARGEEHHLGEPTQTRDLARLLSSHMVRLVTSRLLISYVVGAITAVLPVFLVEKSIMSEPEVPLLFAWASMFNVLGRPLSSFLKSPVHGIIASPILITITGMLFLNSSTPTLYLGMALYGLALGLFIPSSLLMVQSLVEKSSLTMGIALLTLAIDLGASLGSMGAGIMREFIETELTLSVSAIAAGLASLLLSTRFAAKKT
ncbi:MAG: MFS transporter [Nitrososphaerota archaeon]